MAGGKGTRLRPLTCGLPKPMVPILNKPVMEYAINLLSKHSITDIAVTLAYLPEKIIDYFGTGEQLNVKLNYFVEEVPLGTAGSVKNCGDFLDQTFIVISGDALTDLDLTQAIEFHKKKKSKATLVLRKEPVPLEYGVVIIDSDGKILRFLEKPSWGEVFSNTINTGIYILEPEVLDYYQKGDTFDFSKDLFPKLLEEKIPMYGYVMDSYWNDIGALTSYKETQFYMLSENLQLPVYAKEIEPGIWVDEGTLISKKAKLIPPLYIGKNCVINDGVELGPNTVLGDNCKIGASSTLKNSTLWTGVKLGNFCEIRGAVLCSDVQLSSRVKVYENSVIGQGSILKEDSTVKPEVKIWPEKRVEEGTVLTQNLIWGTQSKKNIFGNRSVKGDINIDMTPEFAAKLGCSFGSVFKKEGAIVVGGDDSKGSSLIKNAFIAGVQSTGQRVIDVRDSILPMTRFAIRHFNALGGIHVKGDALKPNTISIEFLNEKGANISKSVERELENLLCTEGVKRCDVGEIKEVIQVDNLDYFYIEEGKKYVSNLKGIKEVAPSVNLLSSSLKALEIGTDFLKGLGCKVIGKVVDNISHGHVMDKIRAKAWKGQHILTAVIKENGESLVLIDNRGRMVAEEAYQILVYQILLNRGEKLKLIAPHTFPEVVDRLGKTYNCPVIRTKNSPSAVMNEMLKDDQGLGNYLQFILNYDAVWGLGIILDFLVQKGIELKDLMDGLPKFYYQKREVPCNWEDKGRVIKELMMENQITNKELFEGVRIEDKRGWGVILPDNERPVFKIYAEGVTEEYARELCEFFTDKVKGILETKK
ncbi:sugar phosphate nucleotidyltransferase [Anaerobranca gottschalkii]|uniref:Mannose-1-phosphate guanylyltransferase / phosphomannomutase n=1 Tax=Anaerobranca gottschalkii DSM 13577 TaxID=1120990 RepID=A0A1H9YMT8_9FIRM|nr:sugar phosphate nucleotidyltransferase [Anaerobranca gottschalkii]SES70446.1 mannose-1-phosphate guanylyltransferase / phosphomannomutase [Anaerobranca gottschalkii DSM 13577]